MLTGISSIASAFIHQQRTVGPPTLTQERKIAKLESDLQKAQEANNRLIIANSQKDIARDTQATEVTYSLHTYQRSMDAQNTRLEMAIHLLKSRTKSNARRMLQPICISRVRKKERELLKHTFKATLKKSKDLKGKSLLENKREDRIATDIWKGG